MSFNVIYGTSGHDYLAGGHSADYILGFNGNDILVSRGGNDVLDGGYGNDTLDAFGGLPYQPEYDFLVGHAGSDTFVLGSPGGKYYLGEGHATIADFRISDNDKIMLHGAASHYTTNIYNGDIQIFPAGSSDLIGVVQGNFTEADINTALSNGNIIFV